MAADVDHGTWAGCEGLRVFRGSGIQGFRDFLRLLRDLGVLGVEGFRGFRDLGVWAVEGLGIQGSEGLGF